MEMLLEFLEEEEENEIWLLVPSGLVSGKLQIHPDGYSKAKTAALSDALFYSGDIAIDIVEAVIRIDQISGWGKGAPTFIDKEE